SASTSAKSVVVRTSHGLPTGATHGAKYASGPMRAATSSASRRASLGEAAMPSASSHALAPTSVDQRRQRDEELAREGRDLVRHPAAGREEDERDRGHLRHVRERGFLHLRRRGADRDDQPDDERGPERRRRDPERERERFGRQPRELGGREHRADGTT